MHKKHQENLTLKIRWILINQSGHRITSILAVPAPPSER